MNYFLLFMALWHRAVIILILKFVCISPSFAENTTSTVFSKQDISNTAQSLVNDKTDLTLRDAIQLALQHNPDLAAFDKETRALGGVILQAGLLPNPLLQIDSEDIGTRPNSPGARFVSIRISQLIEMGGKRTARINSASLGQKRAEQDFETRRLDLIAQVANVFTDVLAGQRRLQLVNESLALAQTVVDTVAKRVLSGKVPPIEETRAKVAFATTRIEFEQAYQNLEIARKQLALLWGEPMPGFERALGDLESFVAIPDFNILAESLHSNPAALGSRLNLAQRKAILELQKAQRIPDITLDAGVRRFMTTEHRQDTTALVGLSIPLPIFNRNQGNILEAHERVDKAEDEWAATDLRLRTLLVQAYEALIAAHNQINMLREEILPGAREASVTARRGYELGRFGFLEMLDAQRTLFQNQALYLQALANYQRLVNEIERLIAQPIDKDARQIIN
ncbi:outer membrane protein, cobalt-zinc-cadmium efflux system [Nitrosomonas cryotolerans]|uniref:Outer membrane protein, cobalt-zinc-cadmium efflux system n=1 Tax=Nitrosomonas cryotolerans ATCC 49181 TaxID=1131553 RepID=A0A1N6I2W2_9PROT|nr:TolC family protein [Nitrosomonas cryotolerans]SFP59097.1 outer membrane protein, cobalt-zinc-cadmium efflux system [Nitrosomonas cryotolerans]SIO26350.1 outer membrane protein, cobalt-zinc-cadmium efflux system [Nitrosomonas cryotolerans ATCC 49181]